MPATNYTPILLYRTATASTTAPAAGNLNFGELAINYNASGMILYAKNASGSVIKLMNNPANLLYPTADGSPNQAIVTNGSGTLSFASVTTSPGGSTTQVQYNNAGAFGGSANFVWDNTNARLGIGTSSPNVALDVVSGSVNTVGDSLTDQTSSVTGPNRAFSTHVGVLNVATNTAAGIDVGGSIGFGGRWTGTTQAGFALIKGAKESASTSYASYLAFYTRPDSAGMSERMRITSAGLVGIGTSTPNTFTFNNLVVASGSANAGMAIYGTGQTTLAFATATSGADSYRGYIQYTGGVTDAMTFGTAYTERMRIDSAGRLLVGTTSLPTSSTTSLAHIYGNTQSSLRLWGTNQSALIVQRPGDTWSANDYNDILWQGTTGGGTDRPWGRIRTTVTLSAGSGGPTYMSFYTNGDAASDTERMRIDSSGKVGIGVTPSSGSGFSQRLQIKQADGIYSGLQIQKSDDDSILGVGYWTTPAAFSFVATYTSTGSYLPISFYTNNAENLRINTNGTIKTSSTISVGNATPSASGAGITFPATQSASSDANTLDDYEEGTWTPSIAGTTTAGTATYVVREANYTKIGNLVYFSLFIDYTSGTGTGNTKITGLPFSSSSSNVDINACAVNIRYLTYTGDQIVAYTEQSSSAIVVAQANSANFGEFALPYDSGADFAISGFYQV